MRLHRALGDAQPPGDQLVGQTGDNATGALLATSNWFSWQDCQLCGGV